MAFTYWLYDSIYASPKTHGYVGVSEDPKERWQALRGDGRVPEHATLVILFEGTRERCKQLERRLRPKRNIGWNRAVGGVAPDPVKHGYAVIGGRFPKGFWGRR